jgi:hypothetical protein
LALASLGIFVVLDLVGDSVHLKLPFLATSESVREHLKMGFWAFGVSSGLFWLIGRTGSLAGLSLGVVLTLAAIFTVYHGGEGWAAAVASVFVEDAKPGKGTVLVSLVIWLLPFPLRVLHV